MRRTMRSVVLVGLVALVAGVLAACGGGTAPASGGTGPGTGPVTASIGPAGGTVTSSDGIVTLTVPRGALTETLTFGIAPATTAPNGAILTYDLTPSGTTFVVPATLTVDTRTLSLPTGTSESDVRIETAAGGAWHGLFTTLDSGAHTASASLAHLSTYGVVVPALTSRLVLGWVPADPIVATLAESTTDSYQDQVTIHDPAVAPPTAPTCGAWDWLTRRTYYDAGGVQWTASAPPSSATPYPAFGQEAFSVLGSGTGFAIATKLQASADSGGEVYVGYTAGNAGSIGPFTIAEIDNPSGAQRTLSLRWASSGSFNGSGPDGYFASSQVEYDYQAADGTCSGGSVSFGSGVPGTPVGSTTSYTIPAGSVKIWVDIASYATFDISMDTMRAFTVKGALDDELDVQVE